MTVLHSVDDPGRLADLIAANLRLRVDEAQRILEAEEPVERLQLVNEQLSKEVEVAAVQARIQNSAREGMDKAQKDYFLREQMKAIRRELGERDFEQEDEMGELAAAIAKAGMPTDVRKEAEKQLRRLGAMHGDSSEATVVRTYLDWLIELPWKKMSKDQLDIHLAAQILDEDHYGLHKVKDRILEYLSVRKLNPESKGPILCFVGPPGVGKTSLGRSIARALKRRFQRLSLGGMRDEAEIRGHRRTYIGSMPGRIIQALKQAGTRNPVVVLDEVDKLGTDFRGDPSSALLEALDPEQNFSFSDHYLNVPFDLSKVMFICTANHLDAIPSALRDRMEVIALPGYTMQEKLIIAQRHLLPKMLKDNGLQEKDLTIHAKAIERIIQEYTREAGLRNLERELGALCRKIARRKA
jgi:ATP-dependent Lon protease